MTKAVLPSGTWCDVNSLKASVTAEQAILFLHRMDDKGEVKCIKFSIGNKILAVQRTPKSVVRIRSCLSWLIIPVSLIRPVDALQDFINFTPDYAHIEFTQECKVGHHAASSPACCLVWIKWWRWIIYIQVVRHVWLICRWRTPSFWASVGRAGMRSSLSLTRESSSTRWPELYLISAVRWNVLIGGQHF